MKSIILAGMMGVLLAGTALAVEGPSVEMGENLFQAESLGTSGKSCSTCHLRGKGLDEIGAYSDDQLKEMINFCIRDALQGKTFDLESTELESMLLYLRSLPFPSTH